MADFSAGGTTAITTTRTHSDTAVEQRLAALTAAEMLGHDTVALREVLDILDLTDSWREDMSERKTGNKIEIQGYVPPNQAAVVRGKSRLGSRWTTTPMR